VERKAVKFFKTGEPVVLPTRGSIESAGYDISSAEDFVLLARTQHMFKTNVGMELRQGEVCIIKPRSKLANKFGIDVLAGVVDSDYRGEIRVILINHGKSAFEVSVGDRIAQMLVLDVVQSKPVFIANTSETERGAAGVESKDLRL
jgi:dUTP pyrophosphatase